MKNPREGRIPQEGILLSLLLGAAAVGVIGYLLFAQPAQTDSDSLSRYEYEGESVSASDPVADIPAMEAGTAEEDEDDEDEAAEDAEDVEDEEADEDDEEDEDEPAQKPSGPAQFAPPTASNEVTRPYSVDALSYDETMQDWRTHAAVDYGGTRGDAVTAFTDGTVIEIGEDALRGGYVVLNHADGVQSCYAGVEDVTVQEGDNVTCGQQIASLGDPMPAESKQGVHLHLAVTKEGEPMDPYTLMNSNSSDDAKA